MNWTDFLLGGMSVLLAQAVISIGLETEEITEDMSPAPEPDNVVVNDFSRKRVVLYCEDCRKKQYHKIVQPNLYQCNRCKRTTDLRVS